MQRGCADILESVVAGHIRQSLDALPEIQTFEASSKRSIEDFSVLTPTRKVYVDIKSRDLNGQFSMPNLISVDRLQKLYSDESNALVYLFVDYVVEDGKIIIKDVCQAGAEELDITCLQVQNLGKGQLQMRQGVKPVINRGYCRAKWMKEIVALVIAFHQKQLEKTQAELNKWMSLAAA